MRFGNGTTETLELDDRQRPYHLVTGAAADPVDLTYGYDWAGNVTSILDPRSGKSAWYQYDGLDRLTNVTGFGANTFTYDALGNRLTKGAPAVTYTYDPGTNRLSAATSAPGPDQGVFEYDAVGNMTSDGVGGTYGYSPRNTMISATLNGTTTQYTYDADGLRIQKSSASGQQYFVRGLGGQLLAEYAALFSKSAPASGHQTTNPSPTLQWTPVIGATAYAFCVDTTNNNNCDTSWTGTGMATTTTVSTLAPGTYYWQALAWTASGWKDADNGAWWSVTIYTSTFGKQGPPSGQSGLGSDVTLQWGAVPDSGYWVCWDTTDNNSCDGTWWPNGGGTTRLLQGLGAATYYWQVRAQTPNGMVDADGNMWWSFTVGAAGGPSKLAPAPDLAGLSTNVLLQWTSVPNEGYYVCWDSTNNTSCDTTWWPNGGATSRLLEGLSPGMYYWQVKTTSGSEFNSGAWWAFTVGAPVVSFNKQTPGNGGILTTNNTTLSWTTAPGAAFYETCVDTINNGICDTTWSTTAQATTRTLTALTDATYYWQVRATTVNGTAPADNGTWWSFTIDAPDPIREYIYFGGELLASLTLTTATPVLTYYHTDVLGSVRAITSATGAPLTRHDYSAFGESTSSLQGDPRRFLGQERDAETAFDQFGARYYRNVWGRFTSVDPIFSTAVTNPQRWNRYSYALNNPLRFMDASGLDAEDLGDGLSTEEGSSHCVDCEAFGIWSELGAIQMTLGYLKQQGQTVDIAAEIVRVARGFLGETGARYSYAGRVDDFGPNTNKCNKFVYDVLRLAGAPAYYRGIVGRQPLAGDWADRYTVIPNWRVLKPGEMPRPGDGATGHSGIVVEVAKDGFVLAIAGRGHGVDHDASFNTDKNHTVTYRRYTGG